MRKRFLFLGLAFLVFISGFLAYRSRFQPVPLSSSSIKLGAALALTGDAAAWGEAEKNGITLALEELNLQSNDAKVNVIFEDTRSLSSESVLATSKLINVDHVQAIIGPTWLDSYAGAAPLSDQNGIIMLTPSAAMTAVKIDEPYPYVFSTWYDADTNAKALVRWVARRGHRRVMIVTEQDAYWQDIVARFRTEAPSLSVELIDVQEIKRGEADFRTTIAKIKRNSPDAVMFGFLSEQGVYGFLKQRQELGLTIPMYSNESIADFLPKENFRGMNEGVYSVVPKIKDESFASRYKRRFGTDPGFSASNAYDAVMILSKSIWQDASSDKIRDHLTSQIFQTVTFGEARFNEKGAIESGEFTLKTMRDGKLVEQD